MSTRELFSLFGQHVLVTWMNPGTPQWVVMVDDGNPAETTFTTAYASSIPAPATDNGFTLDSDATGRWWICFADDTGVMNRYYSEDCGHSWIQCTG